MFTVVARYNRGRENLHRKSLLTGSRFIDCEKWRSEYAGVGVEELVRTFDYKERPEVFKYYPQYYHKTDKVSFMRDHAALSYLCISPAT